MKTDHSQTNMVAIIQSSATQANYYTQNAKISTLFHICVRHLANMPLLDNINSVLFQRTEDWSNGRGCISITNYPSDLSTSFYPGILHLRLELRMRIRHVRYLGSELIIGCIYWLWNEDDWNTLLCCNVWHICTPIHNEHTTIAQQPH